MDLNSADLLLKIKPEWAPTYSASALKSSLVAGETASDVSRAEFTEWNGLLRAELALSPAGSPGDWTLALWHQPDDDSTHERIDPEAVEDAFLVFHYTATGET